MKELNLSPGEYINRIECCAGKGAVHFMVLRTNWGRSEAFGESPHGKAHRLHHKGWPVQCINVGLGENMHYIGARFVNPGGAERRKSSLSAREDKPELINGVGEPVPGSSSSFNDLNCELLDR